MSALSLCKVHILQSNATDLLQRCSFGPYTPGLHDYLRCLVYLVGIRQPEMKQDYCWNILALVVEPLKTLLAAGSRLDVNVRRSLERTCMTARNKAIRMLEVGVLTFHFPASPHCCTLNLQLLR